jgi:predicted phosphodiesterase
MRRTLRWLFPLCLALASWAAGPPNDFRFAILGDRTGRARQAVYAQTWGEIDRFRPDFVINAGDTIQGTDDRTAGAQWKEIRAFLDAYRKYTLYLVPGNHDIWSGSSQKLFEREAGHPATYSFSHQNAHFIVLDNSRSSDLAPEQLKFLEEDLKKNRASDPTFVFFHKPFWLIPLKFQSGAFALHRLAREYGVDYVVSGHGHQLLRLERDGVTYLEVGSSGANIGEVWNNDSDFAKGLFYHYVQAQVTGARAQLTVKELDPPFGKGRKFMAEDWSEDGLKPRGVKASGSKSRSATPSR